MADAIMPPPAADPVAVFVGKEYPYYQAKWAALAARRSGNSWNWAAFLFGPFWLAYRKMYVFAWAFAAVVALDGLCQILFQYNDRFTGPLYWGINAAFAWQGNALYKRHVDQRVGTILASQSPAGATEELARQGGTSAGSVLVFVAVFLVLGLLFVLPDL